MAKGLALDLGLNIDYVALAGSVKLATEEIELRRQIYWALYCNDKLAGAYVGRVCTMLVSHDSSRFSVIYLLIAI
jgi:hypothetical protein